MNQSQLGEFTAVVVEEEELALIASCPCNIVGIQHYTGTAHEGEFVRFVREPHNPYDRNAVRVDNMQGESVGHIKHNQAKLLVPYLDNGDLFDLQLEGTIPHPGDGFKLPCSVDFYAVVPFDKLESRSRYWVQRLQTAFRGRFCFKS
jgi:SWI/SNF-related matrix-associated actin-dependent regulator of chromatin subfamily A3